MEEAVIDAPEVETEIGAEIEGAESPEGQQQPEKVDPYSSKYSREMSQALKAWRDANPEAAKYARTAKDDHSRLFQLHQMEPKGIDGVREKYALLDSVIHGELKGTEALAAIQDDLRSFAEVDEFLAAGDPRALEALGDDFNGGLAKLAPAILDRVRASDPEAYSKAVLPHFVEALKGSPLVADFNGLVDVLNEGPPSWLTKEQKEAWSADRLNKIITQADRMAKWLNGQMEKAGSLKAVDGAKPNGVADERAQFEKEQQSHHWTTNINPGLDKHADTKFQELFRPYAKRLRLDSSAAAALKQSFVEGVTNKAKGNKPYMDQIKRYHGQKNPNASTVLNFAKVEFDKHAKTVLEGLVNERYKSFLNGKPKTVTPTGSGAKPVSPGVQIVSVKPAANEINYKATPLDWLHQKKYKLNSGKIVQVRQ